MICLVFILIFSLLIVLTVNIYFTRVINQFKIDTLTVLWLENIHSDLGIISIVYYSRFAHWLAGNNVIKVTQIMESAFARDWTCCRVQHKNQI
jgi:hypothetical protein